MLSLLKHKSYKWLITGCAGFIGSNLLEYLLKNNQKVVGLDNFATGHQHNLDEVQKNIGDQLWGNFEFIHGDIRNLDICKHAMKNVDYILHQAALGSIPRSIDDPLNSHDVNVNGFLNILKVASESKVKKLVYASSSSVYGSHKRLPKKEGVIGDQMSPYAATKYINELYAGVFSRVYGIKTLGLRYFNVFGPRQDPYGAYAAVIPLWFKAILLGETVYINGDGETSRDFCFVENVVHMNILSALTDYNEVVNPVFNVACNDQTTLNELFDKIKSILNIKKDIRPFYRPFRSGDIKHSLADISYAKDILHYQPQFKILDGLIKSKDWYKSYFLK